MKEQSSSPTAENGEWTFPHGDINETFELLDDVIGEGAFGRVVLAKNRETGEEVAIKIMDKRAIKDLKPLEIERKVLMKLKHENIVNLIHSVQDKNSIYMALELAKGGELFKYIHKFGLDEMNFLAPRFIAEVVKALEYVHSMGIVHKDMKPENILLTSTYHVKLADFGSAAFEDDPENNKFTGTAQYVSPEVLENSRATKASDLWALGCIVYQLFTGKPPFEGDSTYLIFQAIKERKIVFPPGERYFPASAKSLVNSLLVMEPEGRLGMGKTGYEELKKHEFFKDIDFDKLAEYNNVTIQNRDHTAEWSQFLLKGEKVVLSTMVKKTRRLVSVKKRQLILTDYPRLFYIKLKQKEIKGKVPWSKDMWAEVMSSTKFNVHTADRIYEFDCLFEGEQTSELGKENQ